MKSMTVRLYEDGDRLLVELIGANASIKEAVKAMLGVAVTPISGLDTPPAVAAPEAPAGFTSQQPAEEAEPIDDMAAPEGYASADDEPVELPFETPADSVPGDAADVAPEPEKPEPQQEPETKIPYGIHKGMLPSEVIARDGVKGWISIAEFIPSLQKRIAQWPQNKDVIRSIQAACIKTLVPVCGGEARTPRFFRCLCNVMPEESVKKTLQALSCPTVDDVINDSELMAQAFDIFFAAAGR